jgi:hypothetical protein
MCEFETLRASQSAPSVLEVVVNTVNLDMLTDEGGALVTVVNEKFDLHKKHFFFLAGLFMVSYLFYCFTVLKVTTAPGHPGWEPGLMGSICVVAFDRHWRSLGRR